MTQKKTVTSGTLFNMMRARVTFGLVVADDMTTRVREPACTEPDQAGTATGGSLICLPRLFLSWKVQPDIGVYGERHRRALRSERSGLWRIVAGLRSGEVKEASPCGSVPFGDGWVRPQCWS